MEEICKEIFNTEFSSFLKLEGSYINFELSELNEDKRQDNRFIIGFNYIEDKTKIKFHYNFGEINFDCLIENNTFFLKEALKTYLEYTISLGRIKNEFIKNKDLFHTKLSNFSSITYIRNMKINHLINNKI